MKKTKIKEIIKTINSAVDKSRDTLSEDEMQAISKTIKVCERLDNSDADENRKNAELIAIYLLKFFSNPELIKQITEWFDKLFNN